MNTENLTASKQKPWQSTKLYNSSVFRLTLLYVLLFAGSVLAILSFFYWTSVGYLTTQTDETINAEIQGLAERYRTDGFTGLRVQIAERLSRQQPGESTLYLLTDERYRLMLGNINQWPDAQADPEGWLDFELNTPVRGASANRVGTHMARGRNFLIGNRYHLLVGRGMSELQEVRQQIVRAMIFGVIATVVLALAGGGVLRRSLTRRLEAIIRTSRQVIRGDLSERVPTRHSGDEFDELSDNLNQMLSQIQQGMDGVRRVSDNIAHDLKTPLARLRNRLEELRMVGSDTELREQMIDQVVAEADGLLATFNALLRIARIESRGKREAFTEVDLSSILRDLQELYEALAEEKQQAFDFDAGQKIVIEGDRDMLFQALANLLDNAIKYTPRGGVVGLRMLESDGETLIQVCDSGPGIPESEHDNVIQRFYRMDESRTTPGSGLGLALADAVFRLHDMELRFSNNHPGLCVTVVV
ncbi:MAG: HAMP domain-containing histidine kinase [Proteobacteria bacterium]|jgi:signal transduction histidine kinase|nr:HAMP domain-containing histidine kinase [Pseudomonadota bacterium]